MFFLSSKSAQGRQSTIAHTNITDDRDNQARRRHININFLVRLLLGHPGNVPGTNRVCPRDKVGLSQGQTQVFFLFYTAEAQFVPGTNPVCPWDIPGTKGARQSLCVKSLCAFFVPYSGEINSVKITARLPTLGGPS